METIAFISYPPNIALWLSRGVLTKFEFFPDLLLNSMPFFVEISDNHQNLPLSTESSGRPLPILKGLNE